MNTPKTSSFAPPEKSRGDLAHALVTIALGTVPVVGAPGAEVFAMLVAPPYQRRLDAWMTGVGEALQLLSDQMRLDLNALQANDAFVDTVLQVTQSALRTSQEKKLHMLRNVVINRAMNVGPDLITQQILLGLVDSLTPLHIQILGYFRDGELELHWKHPEGEVSPTYRFFECFDELKDNVIGMRIWQDLNTQGLIEQGSMSALADGMIKVKASALGLMLLQLIAEPPAGDGK